MRPMLRRFPESTTWIPAAESTHSRGRCRETASTARYAQALEACCCHPELYLREAATLLRLERAKSQRVERMYQRVEPAERPVSLSLQPVEPSCRRRVRRCWRMHRESDCSARAQ